MDIPASSTTTAHARFLADRLGFGSTNEQVAQIAAIGWRAWLDAQLDPGRTDPPANTRASWFMPTAPAEELYRLDGVGYLTGVRWQAGTWLRAVYGERQLFERLVQVWSDLLHVPVGGGAFPAMRVEYDHAVLRRHALGTFGDLLVASASSPAMLRYLDAADSVAAAPNENYARELLELHTVGVGAFTETDVRQLARALTGRRVDARFRFVWDASQHDAAAVEVLGYAIPARIPGTDMLRPIEDFLRWLALHPATAERLATRLCRTFVGDEPPTDVVAAARDAYLASGGATPATVRAIVGHGAFWASAGAKLRRPFEHFAAMARALRTNASSDANARDGLAHSIVSNLVTLGHAPGAWPAPDGFPTGASFWLGGTRVLARWQAALRLSNNLIPYLPRNDNALLGGYYADTAARAVDHLATRLLGRSLDGDERQAALNIVGNDYRVGAPPQPAIAAVHNLMAFLLGLPANQRT